MELSVNIKSAIKSPEFFFNYEVKFFCEAKINFNLSYKLVHSMNHIWNLYCELSVILSILAVF